MTETDARVERLLAELTQRYELEERFVTKVRPMVARIYSDEIPDERRTWLLEFLAQTCQNDLLIRRRFGALDLALKDLFGTIAEVAARLQQSGIPPRAQDG